MQSRRVVCASMTGMTTHERIKSGTCPRESLVPSLRKASGSASLDRLLAVSAAQSVPWPSASRVIGRIHVTCLMKLQRRALTHAGMRADGSSAMKRGCGSASGEVSDESSHGDFEFSQEPIAFWD